MNACILVYVCPKGTETRETTNGLLLGQILGFLPQKICICRAFPFVPPPIFQPTNSTTATTTAAEKRMKTFVCVRIRSKKTWDTKIMDWKIEIEIKRRRRPSFAFFFGRFLSSFSLAEQRRALALAAFENEQRQRLGARVSRTSQ